MSRLQNAVQQLKSKNQPTLDNADRVLGLVSLSEATMKPDDFFKRTNQKDFVTKAVSGEIIGTNGKKFPPIKGTDELLIKFKELDGEPDRGSSERVAMDKFIKTYFGGYSKIEKAANGFGKPSSGEPSGEDWESLITVAVNKINKSSKWNQGAEWARAEKFWADYESQSMKLGNAFITAFKLKNLEQLGASTLPTNPEWKGINKTPKTDLISGKKKISLKKAGGSQLMSAGTAEAISTFEAAMGMYSIDRTGRINVNKVMDDIEKKMGQMSTATTIGRLEKLRDSGKKLSKVDKDAIEEMEGLQLNADYLNKKLDSLFKDQTFKEYFSWEASTGQTKFNVSGSEDAISNLLVVFSETGSIKNSLLLDSPSKAGKIIASQNSFYVSFKTGGSKSKPYLSLRSRKFSPKMLTAQVTFRDIVLEELSKSQYGQNFLIESELQQLDEFQILQRLATKVKGVAGTIKNTVVNIYKAIMKRVTQAFNYIKKLGVRLIEGLMNFLGIEVTDVKVKGRGDFALR
jgi:hypothetical protein